MANITFHYIMMEDNAKREDTRKRMIVAQCNLARDETFRCCRKFWFCGMKLPTGWVRQLRRLRHGSSHGEECRNRNRL